MSIINSLISAKLCQALGWTLVHSLWQGAVIALGLMLLLSFFRSDPRVRYRLGLMALLLITLVSLATFGSFFITANPSFQANQNDQTIFSAEPISGSGLSFIQTVPRKVFPADVVSFCQNYINSHLNWIISLWLLGIILLSLRQAGGLLYMQRLKKNHSSVLPVNWQKRLINLGQRIGLKKTIKLMESAQIKTPMAFGYLKPIILFPAGLVTGLPPEQIEALLAHELAHIFRNDYLANCLQNGLETIFFFNPGVRWLSSLVHTEREHCSDDLAVSLCGDALNYARALASLQETSAQNLEPALAATSNSFKVFQRIKRLLKLPLQRPEFTAKSLVAIFLGICVIVLTVSAVVASPPRKNSAGPSVTASQKSKNSASGQNQAGNRQINQEFKFEILELQQEGTVELAGENKERSGKQIDSWLINAKTNQVVWKMTPDKLQIKNSGYSFLAEVFLSRGEYRWYYPADCKISIISVKVSGKSVTGEKSAALLKSAYEVLLGHKNEEYNRKRESERLMAEERKRAEEEKKAEMELDMSKRAEEQQRQEAVEKKEQAIQAEELKKQMEVERARQDYKERKQEEEKLKQQEIEKKKAEADNTKEGDLVSLTDAMVKPEKISGNPAPIISTSIRNKYKGKAMTFPALILIDENGDVTKVKIITNNVPSDIKSILEDALYQWKYSPAMKDNVKVKVWLNIVLQIFF